MKKRVLLSLLMIFQLLLLQTSGVSMNGAATDHQDLARDPLTHNTLLTNDTIEQIIVRDNGEFSEVGFTGNGSVVNPFILENKIIESNFYVPVSIRNTNACFIIRNFIFPSREGGYGGWGIKLSNVTNGRIESCTIYTKTSAIGVEESRNIELVNNTIHDVEEEAIYVDSSQFVNISHNTVSKTMYGIYLEDTDDVNLAHNEISDSSINGIYTYISYSCRITNNTVSDSGQEGIYARFAPSHIIANNTLFNGGLLITSSFSTEVKNNTLDTKPVLYLHNVHDSAYNGNSYSQAILYDCENVNITEGVFSEGIVIAYSEYCRIENVSITSPSYGVYFESSSWCNVTGCNISSATRAGIHFVDTLHCTLTSNNFIAAGLSFEAYVGMEWNQTVLDNTVNGKPLYFGVGVENTTLLGSNFGQVVLFYCYNVTLIGGDLSEASSGVIIGYCENCTIENVRASNSTNHGFFGKGALNLTVRDSFFSQGKSEGLSLYSSDGISILNCTAVSNLGTGFDVYGCDEANIRNNTAQENSVHGLKISFSENSYIINNTFSSNGDTGIEAGATDFTLFMNNTCDNNGWSGLQFSSANQTSVIGNTFTYNWYAGIDFQKSTCENTIYDNLLGWNGMHNAIDWNDTNSWDNQIDTGNIWGDWWGKGVYDKIGAPDLTVIDHYPRKADLVAPIIIGPGDITVNYPANVTLTWRGVDEHPCNHSWGIGDRIYYTPWFESDTYDNFSLELNDLEPGVYYYFYGLSDTCGNTAWDYVTVTVVDNVAPTISSLPDITIPYPGHYILNWTVFDLFPDLYEIRQNGTNVFTGAWQPDEIVYDFYGLTPGVYIYNITIFDESGNTASDEVIVTVTADTQPDSPFIPFDLLVIIGLVGVVVISAGIIIVRRR